MTSITPSATYKEKGLDHDVTDFLSPILILIALIFFEVENMWTPVYKSLSSSV